jgi:hypothetical protein
MSLSLKLAGSPLMGWHDKDQANVRQAARAGGSSNVEQTADRGVRCSSQRVCDSS